MLETKYTGNRRDKLGRLWGGMRCGLSGTERVGVDRIEGGNARYYIGTRIWSQVGMGAEGTERGIAIRITSINIRSGQVGGFEADLRALQQGNVKVSVLQETKLTEWIHAQYSAGYKVWLKKAESRHSVRIAIV